MATAHRSLDLRLRPVLRYTAYRSVRGHTDSLSTEYNGAYVLTYMTYPAVDPLAARSAHLCVWMMHQPFGAASSPLLVPRVCTHSTRHARVPAVPILPHGERARGSSWRSRIHFLLTPPNHGVAR